MNVPTEALVWLFGGGFALGVGGVYCFLSRRERNGKPEGVYGSGRRPKITLLFQWPWLGCAAVCGVASG